MAGRAVTGGWGADWGVVAVAKTVGGQWGADRSDWGGTDSDTRRGGGGAPLQAQAWVRVAVYQSTPCQSLA